VAGPPWLPPFYSPLTISQFSSRYTICNTFGGVYYVILETIFRETDMVYVLRK
jgi:hypothetical protein